MRKAAQTVFPALYENCGYDLVKKKLEGEDKAALAIALPLLEKAREVWAGAGGASPVRLRCAVTDPAQSEAELAEPACGSSCG